MQAQKPQLHKQRGNNCAIGNLPPTPPKGERAPSLNPGWRSSRTAVTEFHQNRQTYSPDHVLFSLYCIPSPPASAIRPSCEGRPPCQPSNKAFLPASTAHAAVQRPQPSQKQRAKANPSRASKESAPQFPVSRSAAEGELSTWVQHTRSGFGAILCTLITPS